MELLTRGPVLLVEHCVGGDFKPNPHGLDVLRRITADGIKVICVAGPFRQGKSYLANKLMGQQSGFGVGHTMRGKTRGVWMWAKQGGDVGEALVVLDTEGLDDPDHPDSGPSLNAKLFTMAVLLSSELLLNTQSQIDQAAINQLGFVTQLAEQIHLGPFQDVFPTLRWVVRDFELQLDKQTFAEYLQGSLSPLAGMNKSVEKQNQIRRVIQEAFPNIKGAPISYPADNDDDLMEMDDQDAAWEAEHLLEEFREDIAAVVAATVNEAPIKKLGPLVLDGSSLASWVENVITAVNKNMIDMPDAIECLIQTETRSVVKKAMVAYDGTVHTVALPVNADVYDGAHERGLDAASTICAAHSMARVHEAAKAQVTEKTKQQKVEAERKNIDASRAHCEGKLEPLERMLKASVDQHEFKGLDAYKHALDVLVAEFDRVKVGPAAPAVMSGFEKRREGDLSLIGMQNKLDQAQVDLAKTQALLEQQEKTAAEDKAEAARQAARFEEDLQRLKRDGEAMEKRFADDRAAYERDRGNQSNGDGGLLMLLLMGMMGQQQGGRPMGMMGGIPMDGHVHYDPSDGGFYAYGGCR